MASCITEIALLFACLFTLYSTKIPFIIALKKNLHIAEIRLQAQGMQQILECLLGFRHEKHIDNSNPTNLRMLTALSLLYKLSFKTKKQSWFIGVLPVSLFFVCICGFFNVYILENANVLKPKLSTEMWLFFPHKDFKRNKLTAKQPTDKCLWNPSKRSPSSSSCYKYGRTGI